MEWIVFAGEGFAQLYFGEGGTITCVKLAGTFTLWRLMASA
jgi:hypothetical protein